MYVHLHTLRLAEAAAPRTAAALEVRCWNGIAHLQPHAKRALSAADAPRDEPRGEPGDADACVAEQEVQRVAARAVQLKH